MTRSRLEPLRRFQIQVGALLTLAIFALPVAGQGARERARDTGANQGGAPQQTKVVPTIRTSTYERLQEAQVCMDEDDLECAAEVLDRMERVRDLNNYEVAQLWNFRAFVSINGDNFEGAVEAYENILDIPYEDMPDGMIQQSMRNLATLYLQLERYQEGLDTFLEWMALPTVTPSTQDYSLLATVYYQMERYADGIDAIQEAIRLANERGEIGEESWYQLLYVFHFELEQTDKVLETLAFMVENWTKRTWMVALAGQLSEQDRENDTLSLYEAAFEAGWLTRGTEMVQLANLLLNASAPYKAAVLLNEGLDDGTIESTQSNWRLASQAWQLAKEDERALPALERASSLADDGEIDRQLAQSFARLSRWDECTVAARKSLDRGGLSRPDLVYMQLGHCLINLKEYQEARNAFSEATDDDRTARTARQFITFVDDLIRRDQTNAELLRSLAAN